MKADVKNGVRKPTAEELEGCVRQYDAILERVKAQIRMAQGKIADFESRYDPKENSVEEMLALANAMVQFDDYVSRKKDQMAKLREQRADAWRELESVQNIQ